jgi:hypothetical protein
MTTKAQIVARLKNDYPTLKTGDDQRGYIELTPEEYEQTISQWADNELTAETTLIQAEAAKEAAEAKLAALGLTTDDLKALGLGNN